VARPFCRGRDDMACQNRHGIGHRFGHDPENLRLRRGWQAQTIPLRAISALIARRSPAMSRTAAAIAVNSMAERGCERTRTSFSRSHQVNNSASDRTAAPCGARPPG
jgi:hypothetical protein